MEPPDPLPAPIVRAMASLERASRPGDVVLQRPGARYPPAPVILIGRRVPYERFTPYLTQFAPREALERRHETVFRFFRTHDRAKPWPSRAASTRGSSVSTGTTGCASTRQRSSSRSIWRPRRAAS